MTIEILADRLGSYLDPQEVDRVRRAYYYAEQAHDGQYRQSGEEYITHPLAVANVLADLQLDSECLAAALLHDVIEDTGIPKEAIDGQFGREVAELVDGVSKLTQIEFKSRAEAQAENFQKMALAMSRDIRVILVKLADRLHNMRTLGPLKPEKRRRIATETLDIYAPIAHRLGIHSVSTELEDLGFGAMYPMRAKYIREAVRKLRGNHIGIIEDIQRSFESSLREKGIQARVEGREKHLHSIYQKMKLKRSSFQDIMDVYALRVVTNSADDCYRILGMVHSLFKPLPGRFKDYIALPKANGYQSLHTTLFNSQVNIEVQIRTEEMDRVAKSGIAAHWLYKRSDLADNQQKRAQKWVNEMLELREKTSDSLDFIEHVKIDLFPDEIYVFTPKGRILELPAGATPIDFAYAIHTDVGNSAVACRINKHLAPLSVSLKSGQTVEIITTPGAMPKDAWMDFAVTGKARSSVRHHLRKIQLEEARDLGYRLLNKALEDLGYKLESISDAQIALVLKHNSLTGLDKMLEEIGLGNRMPFIVARQLLSIPENIDEVLPKGPAQEAHSALLIEGTAESVLTFARCCKPIPGDPIVGYLKEGKGMVIHAADCERLRELLVDPDNFIPLHWGKNITDEFVVELRIEAEKQRGVIAEVASTITLAESSIEHIQVMEQNARHVVIKVLLNVQGRSHLARVMRKLRHLKVVTSLARYKRH
ncbi:RelA/SpoT family protein [Allohahella marinimesophila]|uniref:guanosine-3',5'-bis(diphosphate) 3'-diphosphatase n=1 Tax=Allohahella marinimesophila TaxID=1054972 RepID=A0ABP7PA09_9GAMM